MVKPSEQQQGDPSSTGAVGSGQQQQPEREKDSAVEREVDLAEQLLQEVQFGLRRGGPDGEKPEGRAESDGEDDDVERQSRPGHPHGPCPDEEQTAAKNAG